MKLIPAPLLLLAAAAACSVGSAQTPSQATEPTPGEIIYLPQLPSAESLTSSAQSQGMSIASIRQVNGQELVTYHFANGPDSLIAYRLLPGGAATAAQPTAVAGAVPAPYTTAPAVTYATTAPAYYYSSYPGYYYGYPYYGWYGVGFGGWYGGYWGGYRGGWGGGFRGGYGFGGGFRGGRR